MLPIQILKLDRTAITWIQSYVLSHRLLTLNPPFAYDVASSDERTRRGA